MKAIITLENGKTYSCQVAKDTDRLSFYFIDSRDVPWEIIRTGKFKVDFKPKDEEIGCNCNCDNCLTPIC